MFELDTLDLGSESLLHAGVQGPWTKLGSVGHWEWELLSAVCLCRNRLKSELFIWGSLRHTCFWGRHVGRMNHFAYCFSTYVLNRTLLAYLFPWLHFPQPWMFWVCRLLDPQKGGFPFAFPLSTDSKQDTPICKFNNHVELRCPVDFHGETRACFSIWLRCKGKRKTGASGQPVTSENWIPKCSGHGVNRWFRIPLRRRSAYVIWGTNSYSSGIVKLSSGWNLLGGGLTCPKGLEMKGRPPSNHDGL